MSISTNVISEFEKRSVLYCAQRWDNNQFRLFSRDYVPVGELVRNPDTEKAKTVYGRYSEDLRAYCNSFCSRGENHFYDSLYPIGTPERADIELRIKTFMSSGLFPTRDAFIASLEAIVQKGCAIDAILDSAAAMLNTEEWLLLKSLLLDATVSGEKMVAHQVDVDELQILNGVDGEPSIPVTVEKLNEPRFKAVAAHLGVAIKQLYEDQFHIVIRDVFASELEKMRSIEKNRDGEILNDS